MISEIVVIVVISLLLVLVLAEYANMRRKLMVFKAQEGKIKHHALEQANKIVEDSRSKAIEILKEAKVSSGDTQAKLEEAINQVTEQQLHGYKKALDQITLTVESQVMDKVGDRFSKVEEEIEQYKQKRMADVDKQIAKVLQDTAKKVTGKLISPNDHMELVLDALKKAKSEHLF